MINTLVFDIGNVLLDWSPDYLYAQLIPDPNERATFFRDVMPPEWNIEQDRGRPWQEAEALLISAHPEKEPLIRAYRARWHEMIPRDIPDNVAVLDAAKRAGIPTFAITNFAADTFREAQARFSCLTAFDGVVVSGEEGLLKPDPAIYRLFLSRFAREAKQCLFMDDSAKNVAGAAALGFATIHVTPGLDLMAAVRAHGVMID